jgi:hypothetical protein
VSLPFKVELPPTTTKVQENTVIKANNNYLIIHFNSKTISNTTSR